VIDEVARGPALCDSPDGLCANGRGRTPPAGRRPVARSAIGHASILESIIRGRRGVMPAFEDTLKPEQLKAVSVYVFSRAAR
jgi:mono/diheme cytochrome c family protein